MQEDMKKLLNLIMLSVLALTVSCSHKDEPGDYEFTYDGITIYIKAVTEFYDNEGTPSFTATDIDNVYVGCASTYEGSYRFICNLINNPFWNGKDLTVQLGEKGESGSLKIIGETSALLQQGIYNKIIIDIKGYTPYTLEIITQQMADNGYIGEGVVKKVDNN